MSKKFELFDDNQFGFREKRNTVDALACVMKQIRASKDQRFTTSCVLLDFKTAFETIDHEILFLKLENMGLRGHV